MISPEATFQDIAEEKKQKKVIEELDCKASFNHKSCSLGSPYQQSNDVV